MNRSEKEALRRRFDFRCAYCGVRETDVGAELTVDHFQPTAHGGVDDESNWVYACFACNTFKGALWSAADAVRLLHPIHDELLQHVEEESDARLRGLTPEGALFIELLHLNRPAAVARRAEARAHREFAEQHRVTLNRLAELEIRFRQLNNRLNALGFDDLES